MRYATKVLDENPIAVRLYGDGRESMKVFSRSLYVPDKKCGLCGRKLSGKSHTDHDHQTGLIRGELHHACNVHLGHWEKSKRWMFNSWSGVTVQKVMRYLLRAELQEVRFMYESRLMVARRCYRVAINATSKEAAKASAIKRGLPWLWVYTLAVQNRASIPWIDSP
ncbi:endonuclease domain-containing protein [Vibrio alginolyticus]|uniref:endonuclease domain-containing protein n=1 Tax=Vibrio alginolyticus TaxID=663 RepID=UPI0035A38F5B